ncbi:AAA family ATPase [Azotobacter beijerinckii]|uniref:Predicted ATPase n=1 Tax=Azotobacter beijerinckii TaxID=170623 RepID=A0A1I4AXB8_9GAMM|nr:ATP-binding protein [Azotobacter beijerinckii]SFB04105.1 Predicted ATPase [Azotobacter beijerinckii]SFK61242.1 Predicted ATPase [Azotobacter beijerinckii]
MITELLLENWKSYEKATLHIDPLSVLIGTNASGKSNALDALLMLNRVASGVMLTSALKGDGVQIPLRGGVEWAARRPGSTFALGVTCRADDLTDYQYRLEGSIRENRCDLYAEQLTRIKYRLGKDGSRKSQAGSIRLFRTDSCTEDSPTIVARLYNEKQGSPRQLSRAHSVLFQLVGQKLRQEIQDGVSTVISALRDIFILDPIPSHMRDYSPLAERLESDARNIAGVLAALPNEKQQEIEAVLTRYARQLPERDIRRVYAETVGKFNSDAMLYCEEHWLDEGETPTVDARGMSDGTLRFLAILTALLTRPKSSLLVIEEVDNGLHPSRARLLLEMLKTVGAQRGVDVLVTTHNPALLDAMGTEMVPFITVANRDPATGHSVLTLLEELDQLPKLLAQGPIGRLSSQGLIEQSLASAQAATAEGVAQ